MVYAATDSWSSENSWDIVDASGAVLASGGANSDQVGTCGSPCAYDEVTLTLYDSYGDGGGSVTIDGTTYSLASGSSESWTGICVDLSTCIDVIYAATDSWSSENSWDVVDASGAILASGGDSSLVKLVHVLSLDVLILLYVNADPAATADDGSCLYGTPGCTDATACNYDSAATADDGSYTYAATGFDRAGNCLNGGTCCSDYCWRRLLWQSEVSWTLTNSAGTVVLSGGAPYSSTECLVDDCYTLAMSDAYGDGWNGNIFDMGTYGNATLASGSTGSHC